ncbi:ATPase, T2SS/T4P/T4SS family [Paludicola sp. MB14-C6]|uniref:ATPase, T2SS/T4P/T4SS family n=1 Tax=Paludihabitans sp. MB14-C6 TaxID=3070656 RepID=UPI0027DC8B81|nr:ATPase, T2SS/T4P/T4SS family [Paludicola sp. MB14-C6]WMJ24475.1 ATPase, T2SS/T4P/T4SS family [Paludicola sp. MB14-C6]
MKDKDFWTLLNATQEYIAKHYSAALTDISKLYQLKVYIEKYLRDIHCNLVDLAHNDLVNRLYSEMAEYSVLTKYLKNTSLEEINVNAWNDIAITYRDGRIEKLKEHFHSPNHAVDIVKRLLHHSGMIIDNATPLAQGHLPPVTCGNGLTINTRITALKEPIVDEQCGISCSIRLLHPNTVDKENLVKTNFATLEMISFLEMCMRYGVSVVVAGATSSGKTTLLNALLQSIPDNKRIFSIESGSRELSLVRHGENGVTNNVVHTIARQSDNKSSRVATNYDITQEDLVAASLRFNPDIIAVGEMRDSAIRS